MPSLNSLFEQTKKVVSLLWILNTINENIRSINMVDSSINIVDNKDSKTGILIIK
jgi:hypothetical protein